jgi:hypothetical protein
MRVHFFWHWNKHGPVDLELTTKWSIHQDQTDCQSIGELQHEEKYAWCTTTVLLPQKKKNDGITPHHVQLTGT